jgi:hypothetical protein
MPFMRGACDGLGVCDVLPRLSSASRVLARLSSAPVLTRAKYVHCLDFL